MRPTMRPAVVEPDPEIVLRAMRRTRQIRQFTDEPVDEAALWAILEVARWSGSSMNQQPWTFLVLRDRADLERIADLAQHSRYVRKAPLAIAIVLPGGDAEEEAYDDGRVAERILIAASAQGLGAGIGWTVGSERAAIAELLGIAAPAYVRTIISIGHPTEEARRLRSGPGTGRRPLAEFVRER
jgi:nitroreductase